VRGTFSARATPAPTPKQMRTNTKTLTRENFIQPVTSLTKECALLPFFRDRASFLSDKQQILFNLLMTIHNNNRKSISTVGDFQLPNAF
jgi:hypothetical protein